MNAGNRPHPRFAVSVIAVVIFQVAALVARSWLDLSLVGEGFDRAVAKDLSYLVVPPILLVLMYPYLRRCKDSLLDLLRPCDLSVRTILLGIALGLVLRALDWAGLTLLMRLGLVWNEDPGALAGPLLGFDCPAAGVLLLSFAVMAVLVPLIEEIGNRGFVLHALLPRGKVLAIALSASLFAALHVPSTYPVTFAAGIFFAVQTLNFRTLWASIVAHATYNAVTILDWECMRIVWSPAASDPLLHELAVYSAIVAVIGTPAACYLVSRRAAGGVHTRQRPGGLNAARPWRPFR